MPPRKNNPKAPFVAGGIGGSFKPGYEHEPAPRPPRTAEVIPPPKIRGRMKQDPSLIPDTDPNLTPAAQYPGREITQT